MLALRTKLLVSKAARPNFVFKRGFQSKNESNINESDYGTSLDPPLKEGNFTSKAGKKNKKSTMPEFNGWDESVASRSEADIKADQDTQSIEEMKKQTLKALQKNQKRDEKPLNK